MLFVKFCRMMLTKHVFVHKIDKVYIKIKTREIFVRFSNRFLKFFSQESSRCYWSSTRSDDLIDKTNFELLIEVLTAKNDLPSENVSKFENQKVAARHDKVLTQKRKELSQKRYPLLLKRQVPSHKRQALWRNDKKIGTANLRDKQLNVFSVFKKNI